jgi:predicted acylesterase/phospholipase RssA
MIHPYLREDIDLVIAGGATHVGGLAAAATEIDLAFNVRRVAGTSAGSLIAAAMAFGLTQSQLRAMVDSFLSPSLLDRSLYPPHRFGLHKGDALRAVLTEIFGDARLGDALVPLKIVVCSLWSRTPVVLDSQDPRYAKIRVVDALMASCAIPGSWNCRPSKLARTSA